MEIVISWFSLLLVMAFFKEAIGSDQKHEYDCPDLSCGNDGPVIQFPFRIKNQSDQYCGYPGFELSCNEKNQTLLELPLSVQFSVKNIDYKSQVIEVYDPENCILGKLLKSRNLLDSPFHVPKFDFYSISTYTFLNCTSTEYKRMSHNISCLSSSTHQIYAVWSTDTIMDMPIVNCTKINDIYVYAYHILPFVSNSLSLYWLNIPCRPCSEANGNICRWKKNGKQNACDGTNKSKLFFIPFFIY